MRRCRKRKRDRRSQMRRRRRKRKRDRRSQMRRRRRKRGRPGAGGGGGPYSRVTREERATRVSSDHCCRC
ncbi:hypothetical protein RRG08_034907 [Elysia crispata]|uniref:Uncharacterized protein n=1 Tax=Elysia crispata TaxID=231223 RepID=A0AAE1D313_9GAST|nr:hypothetical protein RRG08_034907 [Elysia crispata]